MRLLSSNGRRLRTGSRAVATTLPTRRCARITSSARLPKRRLRRPARAAYQEAGGHPSAERAGYVGDRSRHGAPGRRRRSRRPGASCGRQAGVGQPTGLRPGCTAAIIPAAVARALGPDQRGGHTLPICHGSVVHGEHVVPAVGRGARLRRGATLPRAGHQRVCGAGDDLRPCHGAHKGHPGAAGGVSGVPVQSGARAVLLSHQGRRSCRPRRPAHRCTLRERLGLPVSCSARKRRVAESADRA